MPQEDIHTVCRIRPLLPRELVESHSQIKTSRTGARCVELDHKSCNKRVLFQSPSPSGPTRPGLSGPNTPGTITRTGSRGGAATQGTCEEMVLSFDYVAGEDETQQRLFENVGAPLVTSCLQGYNSTLLCYGQTASGKTHTMFGGSSDQRGVVPRALEKLLRGCANGLRATSSCDGDKENVSGNVCNSPTGMASAHADSKGTFIFKCSFYEIYQEKVYDLLATPPLEDGGGFVPDCNVREDAVLGVYVENCTEVELCSADSALQVLAKGFRNRCVAETAMNRESSRSHAVFQLQMEYTENTTRSKRGQAGDGANSGPGVVIKRRSKFRLIDLAGSERQRDTHTTSYRLKEAALINKSLSTLGRVINALVEAGNCGAVGAYIPYRDSKLTFLLRDSLGGNSKTTLLATVSPAMSCAFDTLSTLRFVHRAKSIRNAVTMNEECFESVAELQQLISRLRADLESERALTRGLREELSLAHRADTACATSLASAQTSPMTFWKDTPRSTRAPAIDVSINLDLNELEELPRSEQKQYQMISPNKAPHMSPSPLSSLITPPRSSSCFPDIAAALVDPSMTANSARTPQSNHYFEETELVRITEPTNDKIGAFLTLVMPVRHQEDITYSMSTPHIKDLDDECLDPISPPRARAGGCFPMLLPSWLKRASSGHRQAQHEK